MALFFTLDPDTHRVKDIWNADSAPAGDQWIAAPDNANPPPTTGALYDANTHVFTPAKPTIITGSEFINRFTSQEQIALCTASQGNAQMMLMLIRLAAATQVDLTDQEVQDGVTGLVGGILTWDRVNAILDYNWPTTRPTPPPPP